MIDLQDLSLNSAEEAYLLANTPMYLANRLKSDAAVAAISKNWSGEKIIAEIAARIIKKPTTPRERVIPYVLLTALALKNNRDLLRRVKAMDSNHYRWFKIILETLYETTKVTASVTFDLRPKMKFVDKKFVSPGNITTKKTLSEFPK